jgi:hypothetical protein
MDAILDLPPSLPPHDPAVFLLAPHRLVAEWPEGTFLENLALLPGGDIAVSVLSEARLDRVSPDGTITRWRQFEAPPTGLAIMNGRLFVAVGEPGAGDAVLWSFDLQGGEGELFMTLPGVGFANGVTPFAPGKLLVAESWRGQLCLIDLPTKTLSVWLEDERLTRAPGIDFLPGANGVKRYKDEVSVSSNGRAELYRAPVGADGRAGDLTLVADRLRVDDFAYDRHGRLYLCTHIGHSLDRLDRDGGRISLGGPDQGLAGSTACAFGPGGALFVTTTGGILAPPDRTLQPARLVRLDVAAEGHPLDHAWEA